MLEVENCFFAHVRKNRQIFTCGRIGGLGLILIVKIVVRPVQPDFGFGLFLDFQNLGM